jgi:hypothetical protein
LKNVTDELFGHTGREGAEAQQKQIKRTFGRRTGELNGSLSGSARFTSLIARHGQRSVLAATRPY